VSDFLEYRGYYTHVKYSAEDECNYGKIEDISGSITFDDKDYDSVRSAFENAVDDYLAMCEDQGIEPQKPFSGRFVSRISSDLHRRVARRASKENVSINKVVEEALEAYV
jgi:predicted HicB family RNase H-like nuclease